MFEMMWTRSGLKLVSCGETGEEKSISFFTAPRGNGTGALVLYAATREVIKEGWFTLFFFSCMLDCMLDCKKNPKIGLTLTRM